MMNNSVCQQTTIICCCWPHTHFKKSSSSSSECDETEKYYWSVVVVVMRCDQRLRVWWCEMSLYLPRGVHRRSHHHVIFIWCGDKNYWGQGGVDIDAETLQTPLCQPWTTTWTLRVGTVRSYLRTHFGTMHMSGRSIFVHMLLGWKYWSLASIPFLAKTVKRIDWIDWCVKVWFDLIDV